MRYTIFGESHGSAIGVVLQGLPPGLLLDSAAVDAALRRRATGHSPLASARKEADTVHYLSGLFEGKTTGDPLCALIVNGDQHSADYAAIRTIARPGHADYTGFLRAKGYNDYRGGGHFSGRLTAPLVIAGAIAQQLLAARGIVVGAHLLSIAGAEDSSYLKDVVPTAALLSAVKEKALPVVNEAAGEEMQRRILTAREALDSVGGVIECAVLGLPAGIGGPDFGENIEGELARALFAIPAVKGVDFGEGFGFALLRGSEANDSFAVQDGAIATKTNHNGGINGGIANGMPLLFRAVIKATPSIGQPQESVDFHLGAPAPLTIHGRHDPCILPRAVPCVEAATALTLYNLIGNKGD